MLYSNHPRWVVIRLHYTGWRSRLDGWCPSQQQHWSHWMVTQSLMLAGTAAVTGIIWLVTYSKTLGVACQPSTRTHTARTHTHTHTQPAVFTPTIILCSRCPITRCYLAKMCHKYQDFLPSSRHVYSTMIYWLITTASIYVDITYQTLYDISTGWYDNLAILVCFCHEFSSSYLHR